MKKVVPGRFTAKTQEDFVVFLIGMRVNNFLALLKWISTVKAMIPMLRTLDEHPEKGLLSQELFFRMFPLEIVLISYWDSFEQLESFARNSNDPHLKEWKQFNQTIGSDGSVGIWHETYMVQSSKYEAVYANMPIFGLAAATEHVPAVGRKETARRRLGGENKPAVPSPNQP